MIVAVESGVSVIRRDSSSSSLTFTPEVISASRHLSSKTQTRVTSGVSTATSSKTALFASRSQKERPNLNR